MINLMFDQENTGVLVVFYWLPFVLSGFAKHLASHTVSPATTQIPKP